MTAPNLATGSHAFRQLMTNGSIHQVPAFQRDCTWDEGQREDLGLDCLAIVREGQTRPHYTAPFQSETMNLTIPDWALGRVTARPRSEGPLHRKTPRLESRSWTHSRIRRAGSNPAPITMAVDIRRSPWVLGIHCPATTPGSACTRQHPLGVDHHRAREPCRSGCPCPCILRRFEGVLARPDAGYGHHAPVTHQRNAGDAGAGANPCPPVLPRWWDRSAAVLAKTSMTAGPAGPCAPLCPPPNPDPAVWARRRFRAGVGYSPQTSPVYPLPYFSCSYSPASGGSGVASLMTAVLAPSNFHTDSGDSIQEDIPRRPLL